MGLLEERRQRGSTLARVSVIAELTCAAAAGVHMSYQKQKPLIQVSMKNFFVFVLKSFECGVEPKIFCKVSHYFFC